MPGSLSLNVTSRNGKFPKVDAKYWGVGTSSLSKLHSLIEKPSKMDNPTLQKTKLGHARIMVEATEVSGSQRQTTEISGSQREASEQLRVAQESLWATDRGLAHGPSVEPTGSTQDEANTKVNAPDYGPHWAVRVKTGNAAACSQLLLETTLGPQLKLSPNAGRQIIIAKHFTNMGQSQKRLQLT
ncbi:hypothetical protein Cgig2_014489 [Carnegiea gigantea]|uniref:Uncharacterized protein n=1 Tax=Carnegiea gigantea TaxID=171969 RepID=A0A9Q1JY01_9CARY|nr:hypothetical protein Cgig2_014489 [Carnegiea gigantea]